MSFWRPGSAGPSSGSGVTQERSSALSDLTLLSASASSSHLSLSRQRQLLPVFAHRAQILFALEKYRSVVLVAPDGSGLHTQVPLYLDEARWSSAGRKIAVSQAHPLSCVSTASRVAQEANVELGTHVGYSIPFDDNSSETQTRIKFLTDAMFIREMMSDPLLMQYSVVVVNEAHERTLHTDLLLGLLCKIQRKRNDLRVVVCAATLDAELLKDFFETNRSDDPSADSCVVLGVEGSVYPVEVQYLADPVKDYVEAAVDIVLRIHTTEKPGNVLVYLTDKKEVDYAVAMVRERLMALPQRQRRLRALPLYGGLSRHEQLKVLERDESGGRRAVFCSGSTGTATATLAVPACAYVVDCGLVNESYYDGASGMEWIASLPISRVHADKRASRAGRVREGKCFRLYTERAAADLLPLKPTPQIQRSNLVSAILLLKGLGIDNIVQFEFVSPPPVANISSALEQLYALGVLDDYAKLTDEVGASLAELPLAPALGKALLAAVDFGCGEDMLAIAAMLSVTNVWRRPKNRSFGSEASKAHARFAVAEGDLLSLLNVWRAFDANGRDPQWCNENFIELRPLQRAAKIRKHLRRALKRLRLPLVSADDDPDCIRRAIVSGFFSNAAQLQRDGSYMSVRGQRQLFVHESSVLSHEAAPWIVFYDVVHTDKHYMRDVTRIEPNFLSELAPHFYEFRSRNDDEEDL